MANICFGCNDVENIEKCPKKECVHYSNRDHHLEMDTVINDERTRIAERGSAEIASYSARSHVRGG